jgi:hypothetical protein
MLPSTGERFDGLTEQPWKRVEGKTPEKIVEIL